MEYYPSVVGKELRSTTVGLAWVAADIYAAEPASVNAIDEAAAHLAATGSDTEMLPMIVAAVTDAACHLAFERIAGSSRPADTSSWTQWQASTQELWPILIDTGYFVYRKPLESRAVPGRYVAGRSQSDDAYRDRDR